MANETPPASSLGRYRARLGRYVFDAAVLVVLLLLVAVFYLPRDSARALEDLTRGLRGSSAAGMLLGYASALVLVAAQAYTMVKRVGAPAIVRRLGGASLWLNIHIALSVIGLVAGLLHSGFPYRFRYEDFLSRGLGGLTTWLLILAAASGVFGRYLYRRLPAMRRAFRYWKPAHIVMTALLLAVGLAHMTLTTL